MMGRATIGLVLASVGLVSASHCVINDAICVHHVLAKNEISSENDQSLSVTVVDALIHVLNLNTAKTSQSAQDIIALINYALKVGERIVGSREKAAQLPFISIVTKRVTDNCYQRAWYAKSM